jgi:glutamate N-acetyltransferase/amino-acid N-acetyltransferase
MTDPTSAAPGKPGLAVSPLAVPFPTMPPIKGVRMASARAGFYKHDRPDVLVMSFPKGAAVVGVFTRHAVGSAPVDWCQASLKTTGGVARGLIVNAGCANSFTGEAGRTAVERTMEAMSSELGCRREEVLMASTGVIGVVLQYGKILNVLQPTLEKLDEDGWAAAAGAIMTTDTFPKGASVETRIDDKPVRISGIAKGSGMIAPDMATMLAFLATDAAIAPAALRAILAPIIGRTMNAVTVDGDRSTNDTCLLFATGAAGNAVVSSPDDPRLAAFKAALERVLLDLAQQLVRDGEGATKFVKVTINGAISGASARKIARTVCESPLVKTAIAGEDANWGRIVMAVGRADEPIVREKIAIRFGDLVAAKDGVVSSDYSEEAMSAYMKHPELEIAVDVGAGAASATMWTCDLTHGYISINGDYRS